MKNENIVFLPELIDKWSEHSGKKKPEIKQLYDSFSSTIKTMLAEGKDVHLKGLVKFEHTKVSGKCYYDVRSKQKCMTSERKILKAKVSKNLLNQLKQQKQDGKES